MDNQFFDSLDMWEWELDHSINNPIYPPMPTCDFDPSSLFTAPDGHIYTPEEISTMMGWDSGVHSDYPISEMQSFEPGKISFDTDPCGGVIVTDIFGGKHHYSDMDQAVYLTDALSGMPIRGSHSSISTSHNDGQSCCPNLPTDVHTPVDLTFYDNKLEEARTKLEEANRVIENSTDIDAIENARRQANDARNDINYWERCRTNSNYDQAMQNIKDDKMTNDINRAMNDLHDTLYHKKTK